VILAGGLATRYGGRPKGLVTVGGRRIIDRVAGALREVSDELLLIANDESAGSWQRGVSHASDVLVGQGSIGGIHAALSHAGTAVLVVAWDMPFVHPGLLQELRRLGEGGNADAAVPESDSRRGLEPLCAYYAPQCVGAIELAIAAGDRRVVGFFGSVRVARLPADAVSAFGDPRWLFMNVNSPEDLASAEEYASSIDGSDRRTQEQRQDHSSGASGC
jgi:molybdopterin-guanine dinucleotide biosynthesis protein A